MMTRFQILIDTQEAARRIVGLANQITDPVHIDDSDCFTVDAKAILGAVYAAAEFKKTYISSTNSKIEELFNQYKIKND